MDLKERLQYCKTCEKREFNSSIGIVCSLTKEKPNFQNRCSDYVMDAKAVEKIKAQISYNNTSSESVEKESNPVWFFIGLLIAVIKLLLIFGR